MVIRDELHRQIEALPEAALLEARSLLAALEGAAVQPGAGRPEVPAEQPLGTDEEEPFCLEDHLISKEEGWEILDEQSQATLGVGAREFLRRYHAGEFLEVDTPGIIDLVMLVPLAR